jgi:hypothetical protein
MAQGFIDAFNKALPQGASIGLRDMELEERKKQREQEQRMQMNAQLMSSIKSIMSLPPGASRDMMMKLGMKSYEQAYGEPFPEEMAELLKKADAEELADIELMGQKFSELGVDFGGAFKLIQKNPAMGAQML